MHLRRTLTPLCGLGYTYIHIKVAKHIPMYNTYYCTVILEPLGNSVFCNWGDQTNVSMLLYLIVDI